MYSVPARTTILAFGLWLFSCGVVLASDAQDLTGGEGAFVKQLTALEQEAGGRLGVVLLDTGNGRQWSYRGDERFALCSTFKVLLSAAVLKAVDEGELTLDQPVAYGPEDLQEYGPITRKHVGDGQMTVGALSAAAVEYSDNTAANLLLGLIDGPQGVTRFVRTLGDQVTRLDRYEPFLNSNLAGDERDTTTPRAMTRTLARLLTGSVLEKASQQQWIDWMVNNTTGDRRIRAAADPSWVVGDKTGTGDNQATNDVAILWPPGKAPLVLVVYYSGADIPLAQRDAVIARAAGAALAVVSSD